MEKPTSCFPHWSRCIHSLCLCSFGLYLECLEQVDDLQIPHLTSSFANEEFWRRILWRGEEKCSENVDSVGSLQMDWFGDTVFSDLMKLRFP